MAKVGRAARNSSLMRVETITGASADATVSAPSKIIGDVETGEVYFVDNSTHDVVVQLPSPRAGMYFKFIIAAGADASEKILGINTGDADVDIQGTVRVAGANFDVTVNTSAITMAGHGGALQAGDWLEFISDGTDWYVCGALQTASSLVINDGLVCATS
tara:strand:+ start:485 stop:964 length:480 start_codon:yes stop_codon:yes gene_type:complete